MAAADSLYDLLKRKVFRTQLIQAGTVISDLNPLPVKVTSGGGGGAGDSYVSEVTTYKVKTAFTGASLGDVIVSTRIIDATPSTVLIKTTLWFNKSTGLDITAPSLANLDLAGTSVTVAGGSTSANQATIITALGTLATSVKQSDGSQKSQIVDGSGNVIGSTLVSSKQRLDVNLAAGGVPAATAPSWADQVGGVDGAGNLQPLQLTTGTKLLKVDNSGVTQPVSGTVLIGAGTAVLGKVDLNNTSLISTVNSSSTTLAANGVFTGTSEDISQYAEIRVTIISDVASATDGLQMQQSQNNVNWDTLDVYSIPANTSKTFGVGSSSQYFRIVYTNGATIQASFRLQTTYKKLRTKPSSVRPQDGRTNDNDMEEIVAYGSVYNGTSWDRLRGDTTNGAFVNVKTSVLPTNAAQETGGNLATIVTNTNKIPSLGQALSSASQPITLASDQIMTANPQDSSAALTTNIRPTKKARNTFSDVIASGVNTSYTLVQTGSGQTVSQSGGNLSLTTGTTINSETVLRSIYNFNDSFRMKYQSTHTQRIVNQNFIVELVDIIGDGLALTINSATSISVTIPFAYTTYRPNYDPLLSQAPTQTATNTWYQLFASGLTSYYIGQKITVGVVSVASTVPMQATIASVTVNAGTSIVLGLTVAGWPASGSGTCSLFGYNYFQTIYNGATATTATFDAQRKGWNSGTTSITTNTTLSPGHMGIIQNEDSTAAYLDQLVASAITMPITLRASRVQNIPSQDSLLYIQIRSLNSTSAPASGTTWTIGFVGIENYNTQSVNIATVSAQGSNAALPVQILGGTLPTVTTVGTVTSMTTLTTLTTLANGQTAHSAASTGSPLRIAGRVVATTVATDDITLIAGDASDIGITSGQQVITKDFGTSELDGYTPVLPNVTTVTPQSIVAASGSASIRNYVTQLSIQTDTLGVAGNMFIVDNQGAIGTSVTIATPGVFTCTAHDLRVGDTILFTSIGTITGISVNTLYYITPISFAATTFTIALTPGGTAIAITGSTAAFTFYRVFFMFRLNTAAITTPFIANIVNPFKGIPNSNLNVYFPASLLTGAVYINVNGYRGF